MGLVEDGEAGILETLRRVLMLNSTATVYGAEELGRETASGGRFLVEV